MVNTDVQIANFRAHDRDRDLPDTAHAELQTEQLPRSDVAGCSKFDHRSLQQLFGHANIAKFTAGMHLISCPQNSRSSYGMSTPITPPIYFG